MEPMGRVFLLVKSWHFENIDCGGRIKQTLCIFIAGCLIWEFQGYWREKFARNLRFV